MTSENSSDEPPACALVVRDYSIFKTTTVLWNTPWEKFDKMGGVRRLVSRKSDWGILGLMGGGGEEIDRMEFLTRSDDLLDE